MPSLLARWSAGIPPASSERTPPGDASDGAAAPRAGHRSHSPAHPASSARLAPHNRVDVAQRAGDDEHDRDPDHEEEATTQRDPPDPAHGDVRLSSTGAPFNGRTPIPRRYGRGDPVAVTA